jgi:hypothetical protein
MTGDEIKPTDNVATGVSLAQLFLGKTTSTSGTTQTTSETVSQDKTAALIKQIMEGTSGLSAVSSGQKAAGLYNSSTNQLLTNDLMARAAAQVAALSSTKTTQTSGTTQKVAPQVNPTSALGGIALLQLLPKDIKDQIKNVWKDGIPGITTSGTAAKKLIGGDSVTLSPNGDETMGAISSGETAVSGGNGMDLTSGIDAAQQAEDLTSAIDVASSLSSAADASTGIDLAEEATAAAEGATALDAAGTAVDGVAPGMGTLISNGIKAVPDIVSAVGDVAAEFADILDFEDWF